MFIVAVLLDTRMLTIHSFASTERLKIFMHQLVTCIDEINCWMSANRLKLNSFSWEPDSSSSKWHANPSPLVAWLNGSQTMSPAWLWCSTTNCSFRTHIKRLTGKCFYYVCQMRSVRRWLWVDSTKTLVHAFITSWINYYNSVFSRAAATHLHSLQSRLIEKRRKYDSIWATMSDVLHWLPIQKRIENKICDLVDNAP